MTDQNLTVGTLRRLLDQTDLADDAPVLVIEPESSRRWTEDDGERTATRAAASKASDADDALRIHF